MGATDRSELGPGQRKNAQSFFSHECDEGNDADSCVLCGDDDGYRDLNRSTWHSQRCHLPGFHLSTWLVVSSHRTHHPLGHTHHSTLRSHHLQEVPIRLRMQSLRPSAPVELPSRGKRRCRTDHRTGECTGRSTPSRAGVAIVDGSLASAVK